MRTRVVRWQERPNDGAKALEPCSIPVLEVDLARTACTLHTPSTKKFTRPKFAECRQLVFGFRIEKRARANVIGRDTELEESTNNCDPADDAPAWRAHGWRARPPWKDFLAKRRELGNLGAEKLAALVAEMLEGRR